ncbi:MAG: hypothetical protein CMO01_23030 [Thalassobius sp.]|nr:hypothetical protein [Thalassovita sp.]
MEFQEFIKSKKIEKKPETLHNKFYETYSNESLKGTDQWHVAALGLMFLNAYPDYRSSKNNDYYYYHETVNFESDRLNAFLEYGSIEDFWSEKNFPVLEAMFGEEMAPFVKKAWDYIPTLPYQEGYYRRSFRSSNHARTYFTKQLNFIIQLNLTLFYDFTLEEYIIHHNEIFPYNNNFAFVLASLVDEKHDKLYPLMVDIVYNRHETAKVSRPIIKAFLLSNNSEAWKAIEDLLISAQRQEGLRQSILEQLDETSLGALIHFIKVILDNNLTRFSSVVRAVDTWAGLAWEGEKQSTVKRFLEIAYHHLAHPEDLEKVKDSKDNAELYMALWAQGVRDVNGCMPVLDHLITKGTIEKRSLAFYFICEMGLAHISISTAIYIVNHYINDDKGLLMFYWLITLTHNARSNSKAIIKNNNVKNILFEIIERLAPEIPKTGKTFNGKLFSWTSFKLTKENAYSLVIDMADAESTEDLEMLIRLFKDMNSYQRERVARLILPQFYSYGYNKKKIADDFVLGKFERDFALSVLRDRSAGIKSAAINALEYAELTSEELAGFEDMLKSKSADTRKSIINFILKKELPIVKNSVEKLIVAGNQEQRLSGLDMLNQLHKKEELRTWTSQKANDFIELREPSAKEKILIDNLLKDDSILSKYTAKNGYGLYDPARIIMMQRPEQPIEGKYTEKFFKNNFGLSVSVEKLNEALNKLAQLIEQNQDYEYTVTYWDNSQNTVLLGNYFSSIKREKEEMTAEERFNNYPLPEVWKGWMLESNLTAQDLFIVNLFRNLNSRYSYYDRETKYDFPKTIAYLDQLFFNPEIPVGKNKYNAPIHNILANLMLVFPFEDERLYIENLLKTILANIPSDELNEVRTCKDRWSNNMCTWRDLPIISQLMKRYAGFATKMDDLEFARYWAVESWQINTLPDQFSVESYHPSLYTYARAYSLELIYQDELLNRLMHANTISNLTSENRNYRRNEDKKYFKDFSFIQDLLKRCTTRLLEVELVRGDSPTSVTNLAQSIGKIEGIDYLIKILQGLGKDKLNRGYVSYYGSNLLNKQEILSKYLKGCFPLPNETQEDFYKKIKAAKIEDKRLVEAAMYAPQWLTFATEYLGWKGLASAVWWLHAHANQRHDSETETEIARFSKVEVTAFKDGAVDIDWFLSAYSVLGKAKWKMVYDAAKYIADGNGHTRAKLYADVILGNTKIREVTKRVKDKRNQDYLRVYGLVPLSKNNRDNDLLGRYKYLQQFKKESKQFGSQRQASEGQSVKIAMENLARTAGYSDPLRLTWVMETAVAQKIMEDAETLKFDNVEISLLINKQGKAELSVTKDGKELKNIPAKLRKEKSVIELKDYQKTLKDQFSRTFKSLESAMVNRDAFKADEITKLMGHPVLRPMLEKLLLKSGEAIGFWKEGVLVDAGGESRSMGEDVYIAHSYDLYKAGVWSDFQKYAFDTQLKQPFKQIFRELYLPTQDELNAVAVSKRYEGHQVQPKKTLALLKTRGWTVNYEEGLQKVFHKEGFIAKIYAMADWFSPADVESPTLETIEFISRKDWKNVPFADIDGHIFSEIMRDLDLVVSVAHVGDVDPEASHSTVEMRGVLVRETARMFKLKNVEVTGNHVHINGSLGEYSVHLGSAVVHKKPGRYLSILPVHSQHRGRLFLPFVDDDPKSAELMSKVLMLAKDNEIQDPTILGQIKEVYV